MPTSSRAVACHKNANVTYRGVAVGRVESVGLNPNGVTAHMRLNSGTATVERHRHRTQRFGHR